MSYRINFSFTFFLLAFVCIASSGYAQTAGSAKVREKVKKYSDAGKKVRVTSTIGETTKGVIVRYGDSDFTLRDAKGGTERVFEYSKVTKVQKSGGLSTATIVTIAALGAAGAIVAGFVLKRCSNEGGC